jgi:CheY-like chemotaxis protein
MARILLVEDNEQIWDFLSRRLRRRGHEVFLAHDGEKAIESARASGPDVVLMDMNLPVLDGWTAAATLKGDSRTRGIPIIALTAHALDGAREKALQSGCDDYHAKPIDFQKLTGQIESAIARGAGKADSAAPGGDQGTGA